VLRPTGGAYNFTTLTVFSSRELCSHHRRRPDYTTQSRRVGVGGLKIGVFTARRSYASAVLGVVILSVSPSVRPSVRPSVCLSVCLSHACFVINPKNRPVIFLYHMKGHSFEFSDAKGLGEIPTGSPPTGAPNSGGVGLNGDFRPISGYSSQTVQNRTTLIGTCRCSIDWFYFQ